MEFKGMNKFKNKLTLKLTFILLVGWIIKERFDAILFNLQTIHILILL